MRDRIRGVVVGLAVAGLLVAGCGDAAVSPSTNRASGTSPAVSTPSAAPSMVGQPAASGQPVPGQLPDPNAPLPEPTLRDASAISDALYAPERVGLAVVSLLDQMGIPIIDGNGTVVRSASGTPATALTLTEDEVRGLIAMGTQDAAATKAGMPGGSPFTFADLHAAVAPLIGGVPITELADLYARAYDAHPDTLLGGIFVGLPIRPDSALTRVHLWLLLVDGFVGGAATAAIDIVPGGRLALAPGSGWGVAEPALPDLRSPDPRFSQVGFNLMLAHAPLLAFSIPFDAQPLLSRTHEGHGGPGRAVTMTARIGYPTFVSPLDPVTQLPLFQMIRPLPDGISVWWSTSASGLLNSHGAIDGIIEAPVRTDVFGAAPLRYLPKEEEADGQGDEAADVANLEAKVGIRELVTHFYDVPQFALGFLMGDRFAPALLEIGWHEKVEAVIKIVWTDTYDGVADTITFLGDLTGTEPDPVSGGVVYVGTGTATGSRAGWKGCNPGIDVVPAGTGPATFRGAVTATGSIMISAWADISHPLVGISTAPMEVPIVGGFAQFDLPAVGELCPHSSHGELTVTALVLPN
jgi:hypothetical protein